MSAVWLQEECGRGNSKYFRYILGGTTVMGRPLHTWHVDVFLDGEIRNIKSVYTMSTFDTIEEMAYVVDLIERIKHEGAALENL